MVSPRTLTVVETSPSSADHLRVQARLHADDSVVGDGTYPASPTGTTVIPIGSNGLLDSVVEGQLFDLFVLEQKNGLDSPGGWQVPQGAHTNPFTLSTLPDGAEDISVQL